MVVYVCVCVFFLCDENEMEGLVSKDEAEHLGMWRRFRRSGEG